MPVILLISLLMLGCLVVAADRLAWVRAGLLSVLLLALSAWWLVDRLSGDGLNAATLYHLQTGLEGAGVAGFSGVLWRFAGLVLLSLLPLLLAAVRRRLPNMQGARAGAGVSAAFAAVLAVAVVASPLYHDALRLKRQMEPVDGRSVATQYRPPAGTIARPKNIVWIYGESLERTYLDQEAFPGLMPGLSQLVRQGLDFRDIASPQGTGWTIAGIVGSMCGVPLTATRGDENSLGRMSEFLPGARCLPEYLAEQGYRNVFLGGADSDFAAKGRFLRQHGFHEVRDRDHYLGAGIAPEHFSNWGLHDDVLLDDAFDTFMALSEAGQPFLLSTLTMDTHHPAGHLPVACQDLRGTGEVGLVDALACSDRLVSRLVERIRTSPYAADTVIVLASDHLAMPNDLTHVLRDLRRENLLLFLVPGMPARELSVPGSVLDTGATLLSLLDPSHDALGFGRSLLAPAADGATRAALAGDEAFAPYLAFARSLWTGGDVRTLRIEDGRLRIGLQHVTPPVMVEYDPDWGLQAITMEDAPRQFGIDDPANVRAYVDRCTAFDDDTVRGEWCALLVDANDNMKLFAGEDLREGVRVDVPLEAATGPRPRPRRAIWLGAESSLVAGEYLLRLRPREWPSHPFWLEAVASDGRVVAREWIQPGDGKPNTIRLRIGVEERIDDLEIRAWLDWAEYMELSSLAMVRTGSGSRG